MGEVPAYVGAQLVGGAGAAGLIVAAFGGEAVDFVEGDPAQGTLGEIEGRHEPAAGPPAAPAPQGTGGDIAGRRV